MSSYTWQDVAYSGHSDANPYQVSGSYSPILTFYGEYDTSATNSNITNNDGGISYVIEGSFALSNLTAYMGGDMTNHWTMECGNDYLNQTSSPAPTPEPATMFLLGTGLIGLAGFTRKKLFKK